MSSLSRALRVFAVREGGYSMAELITVLAILGTVCGALTTVFVSGTNSELNLNLRFQAQSQAVVALERLRRDVHCASAITPAGSSSSVAITLPAQCPTGSGVVTWCTIGSGTRYALYRAAGATCDATAEPVADYLVTASVFTYTAPVASSSLGSLHVDLPVNVRTTTPSTLYRLIDTIVLRNTTRT